VLVRGQVSWGQGEHREGTGRAQGGHREGIGRA
jgi:hypothetical protein